MKQVMKQLPSVLLPEGVVMGEDKGMLSLVSEDVLKVNLEVLKVRSGGLPFATKRGKEVKVVGEGYQGVHKRKK